MKREGKAMMKKSTHNGVMKKPLTVNKINLSPIFAPILLYIVLPIVVTILIYLSVSHAQGRRAGDVGAASMKISEFFEYCGVPGICGKPMQCEGKAVEIEGWIDYDNIFDHQQYPHLPYEKFVLLDKNGGNRVEVWAVATDNLPIFEKIRLNESSGKTAHVKGIVRGHDLPIMNKCVRSVSITVDSAESISFN